MSDQVLSLQGIEKGYNQGKPSEVLVLRGVDMRDLAGLAALVTGGASGLGFATAQALAAAQAVPVKEIVAAGFKGEGIREQLAKRRLDAISRVRDEWTFIEE